MDYNKPKNIFEAAGQSRKPAKKAPVLPAGKPAQAKATLKPTFSPEIDLKESEMHHYHNDPEINYMFNQMFKMQDEIEGKLNEMYEKGGLTRDQIKNYIDNPDNFPPDLWSKIQKQRLELENKVRVVLKKKPKQSASSSQQKVSTAKERKAKTLGARKNWIPM
jgi:hypothetical protein